MRACACVCVNNQSGGGWRAQAASAATRPASPARFVAAAATQSELLGAAGLHPELRTHFAGTVQRVSRDRPYPAWFHGSHPLFAAAPAPAPPPEAPAPSRWDFVLYRVADLLLDDEDRLAARALLLQHVDTLLEVFGYYARLGSVAAALSSSESAASLEGHRRQFAAIAPQQIEPASLDEAGRAQYRTMFEEDADSAPPALLLSLRQFWQLARDCCFVDDHCDIADIDRLFVLSGRETAADSARFRRTMELVQAHRAGRRPLLTSVSRAFPRYTRSISTEIYLCHAC
eukprot:COSAG01_NODE_14694_length_1421_cov_0.974281_1_plen_286_part_10